MDKYRSSPRKNSMLGFTIVELMIVLAIAGVLVAIANASYSNFMRRSEVNQLARDFETALRSAKHHARTSGRTITVCGTKEIDEANPACLTSLTDFNSGNSSQKLGWVVFYDADTTSTNDVPNDKVFKKVPFSYRRARMVWTGATPIAITPRNVIGTAGVLCVYSFAGTQLYTTASDCSRNTTTSPLKDNVFEKRVSLTTLGNVSFIQ